MVILGSVLGACSVEKLNVQDTPLDPIEIIDQDGRHWDVSRAVRQFGFRADHFLFGQGAFSSPPLILPRMFVLGDPKFPAPTDSFEVAGTVVAGTPSAYDTARLLGFEVADDVVGSRAVAVVYRPLLDDVFPYTRVTDGKTLTLSASGWVYNNQSVLFDYETNSLWYRLDGTKGLTCIGGAFVGNVLAELPVVRTTWPLWLLLHPTTRVLPPLSAP